MQVEREQKTKNEVIPTQSTVVPHCPGRAPPWWSPTQPHSGAHGRPTRRRRGMVGPPPRHALPAQPPGEAARVLPQPAAGNPPPPPPTL